MFELLLVKKKGASIGLNFGIYAGSVAGSNNTTDKYNYLNDAVNPSTNLGESYYRTTGCGNLAIGALISASKVIRYTYSNDTITKSTKTFYGTYQSSSGNQSFCIVHGGYYSSNWGTTTRQYTYSSDTVVMAGYSKQIGYGLTGSGNTQMGLHSGGYTYQNRTQIVDYSSLAWAYGTNLSSNRHLASSFGTATFAVIVGGGYSNNTVDLYDYTTNARTAGQSLYAGTCQAAAAGNTEIGVLGGGWINNTYSSATFKYAFTTSSWSSGTNLSQNRLDHCAVSSSPGWVV